MRRLLLITLFCIPCEIIVADEGIDFFERKIRPVLVEHCYECHSSEADSYKGGLALDSREAMRRGGDTGAAVVPGSLDKSMVVDAIRYETYEMPPAGKLPAEVIRDFEAWVKMGAPDPRVAKSSVIHKTADTTIDWDKARQHWSFQQPKSSQPPSDLSSGSTINTKIDAFVKAGHVEHSITANSRANARTLLRRLSYDLVGLSPTPAQSERFFQTAESNLDLAIEQHVDELLASPRHGEHWAAMWLDLMRYAEDQAHIVGNNKSLFYPNAYLYRDWVIASFNSDMPYDEFVRLQLAADLATPEKQEDDVALGFIGLGPKYYGRGSPAVKADEYEDRIDTVSRGLLGLTVACARCHDHKYDPIPTHDYYALAGVFASTEMFNRPLNEDVEQKNGQANDPAQAMHVVRDTNPTDLNVMIRGDIDLKGEVAPRGFLQIIASDVDAKPFQQGSGRLELADAIISRENPLTARVIVNRVWSKYFGQGLVPTTSNFGTLGNEPVFPALLDDLAIRFMRNGWSLKWLHKEIVLSATYQRSSSLDNEAATSDPDNTLLWRMPRRRLSVEQWRDSLLQASGQLDQQVGGPSMDPTDPDCRRRTIYASRSRFQQNEMLVRFDFPDSNSHAADRTETTTPLQKLFVLNSPFMLKSAERFAELMQREADDDVRRIELAYRRLYARRPSETELDLGQRYLKVADWTRYAQVLLAANEMYLID